VAHRDRWACGCNGIGSSHFGLGAMARLQKYRSRQGMAPKNAICSEMCTLAYQLAMTESDPDFIRLDAKHSTPAKFMTCLKSDTSRNPAALADEGALRLPRRQWDGCVMCVPRTGSLLRRW